MDFDSLENFFEYFHSCQILFSLDSDDFYDMIPIRFFEKSYYRFKEENVRKNMLGVLSLLIKKTVVVYMGKCFCCNDSAFYIHKNNYYCYKHKPKRSVKMECVSPFIVNGKFVKDYSSCMDAFIHYSEKARSLDYPTYEIVYYRSFAKIYLCLSTYMHDAPKGVYPRSCNTSDLMMITKPPVIDPCPEYEKFFIDPASIDRRITEKIDYKKKKTGDNNFFL